MHLFSLAFCVVRYPVDTFRALQASRDRFRYYPAVLLLLLLLAVRMVYLFFLHFPLAGTGAVEINVTMEILKLLIPLAAWSVSVFAVTSIMDGETQFREAVMATMYATVPYILMAIPLTLLSHLFGSTDAALFQILLTATEIWIGFLILVSVMVMNNFSLKKTVLVLILSILFMALICAVGLLMFALASQLYQFIAGVIREAKYALFGT